MLDPLKRIMAEYCTLLIMMQTNYSIVHVAKVFLSPKITILHLCNILALYFHVVGLGDYHDNMGHLFFFPILQIPKMMYTGNYAFCGVCVDQFGSSL